MARNKSEVVLIPDMPKRFLDRMVLDHFSLGHPSRAIRKKARAAYWKLCRSFEKEERVGYYQCFRTKEAAEFRERVYCELGDARNEGRKTTAYDGLVELVD